MIIVCDIWAKKLAHYEFNKNILRIINKIFKKEIYYFGDKEQSNIMLSELNFSLINLEKINIIEGNRIKVLLNNIFNLYKIRKLKGNKIIILTSTPIILFLAKLFFNSEVEIYFFLHSLDILEQEKKGIYKYLNIFFKFKNRKFKHKYIVLGENIKENLNVLFPNMKGQIFSVDHPYSFEKKYEYKKINEMLSLGTIGITSHEKGLDNIFEFIEKNNEKHSFKHIGKSSSEIFEKFKKYFPYKDNLLEKEKFEEEILSLDYILILYPKDSYKLTASGIYFDCIKYNKPLLGLKNEYFEYMFKKYGKIGKLFESIDEIIEYLAQEKEILILEHDNFYRNMENIKKVLNKKIERELEKIVC